MQAEATTPARQRFASSENPHRDDWRASFCDDQTDARQPGLKFSIKSAGTFGKNERSITGADDLDQCFKRAAVDSFLIDWNDIQPGQESAEERNLEQSPTREVIDG